MLEIRCQERFDAVSKFAKENNCHEAFQETLNYLSNYYNRDVAGDQTICTLFPDFAPQSFTFEMCKLVNGNRVSRFGGGMIYWDDEKKWTVHT